MDQPPPFATLLGQIEERSAAFRRAVASTSTLSARVPGCPDWSIADLVQHLGQVHRSWAAAVRAGNPAERPPPDAAGVETLQGDVETPPGDIVQWSAAGTQLLLDALRQYGPDRPCWTWWEERHAPRTSGAVARHQVQEAAIHAYDAQEAVGRPEPIPSTIALDCLDEFLAVTVGTVAAWESWPHPSTVLALVAEEGRGWTLRLSADGVESVPGRQGDPDATVRTTSSELILALYKRVPADAVRSDGDPTLFLRVCQWLDTS